MVTTLSQKAYDNMRNKPELLSFEKLGIELSAANGKKIKYSGYIECDIGIPSFPDILFSVPVIIVTESSEFSDNCPMIIGTNLIKLFKGSQFTKNLPSEWKAAITNINCRAVSVPGKLCGKRPIVIEPYSTQSVTCMVRGMTSVTQVVTENCNPNANYSVCPRVLKIKPNKTNKIAVSICNLTGKVLTLQPKSSVCQVSEVCVVDNFTNVPCPPSSSTIHDLGVHIQEDNLSGTQLQQVKGLLNKWKHVFSTGPSDIGSTDILKHKIVLEDPAPFKQPHRRIPPGMYEEVRQHLKEMLEAGVIRESESPFSSNIVLVKKKDGTLRFCIDWRQLNAKTRSDAYSLPRFDDIVDSLSGSVYFSKLDLRSGYWNVHLEEEDKPKTAFSCGNLGFYEWNRLGFGLKNAPSCFQRLMEKCMGDLHLQECLVFLDDLLIFSKTFSEHLDRLNSCFSRLAQHGLKLKPSKCELFKSSVVYLGHVISREGISTDPDKISAVISWPEPQNLKQLRQFLGFTGFYRRYVKNYSKIVEPLNRLLQGHVTNGQAGQRKKTCKKPKVKPGRWMWGEAQQQSFEKLKQCLTSSPVLGYAQFDIPFTVRTDASCDGLGAVLYQQQDGKERVIAYASRSLKPAEKNYPAHKLEFLALKWAVTDKFHDYLFGNKFTVTTDNNPLTYVNTTAKLDAAGHRWLAALSAFDFDIKYKPGKQNADADGLSRRPHITVASSTIQAICVGAQLSSPLVECVASGGGGGGDVLLLCWRTMTKCLHLNR